LKSDRYLSFDPSGNYEEGKGTTGYTLVENGRIIKLGEIKASESGSAEEYWNKHLILINEFAPAQVVFEGYRLYHHKGMNASKQANSVLETPQLIGVLRWYCSSIRLPYTIQYATDVKKRWSEEILVSKGLLNQLTNNRGISYLFGTEVTSPHMRDSLKHMCHFMKYKIKVGEPIC
jgi:hypothetical protein